MGTVSFPKHPRWRQIAALIAELNETKLTGTHSFPSVFFNHGLTIDRFALEAAIKDFTEDDWRMLRNSVRGSLHGGKITNVNDTTINIRSDRSKLVAVRLRPSELEMVKEAAKKEGKRLSDFLRGKILQGVDEEYERERQYVQLRKKAASAKIANLKAVSEETKKRAYVT